MDQPILLTGRLILVVDDEPDYLEIFRDEFEALGAKTLTASNGKDALDLVRTNPVDAVVSDVRMPGGNGIELLEDIKKLSPKIPVIILATGLNDLSDADIYEKGASTILSKPCDLNELVAAVARTLLPDLQKWRRTHIRFESEIDIQLQAESLSAAVAAKIVNIGRGGLFIKMAAPLPQVGTKITFRISSPDTKSLVFEGSGICRWTRTMNNDVLPTGIGIEFLDLSDRSIEDFLAGLKMSQPKAHIPLV
jgi:CheY-like chemotaxis protein